LEQNKFTVAETGLFLLLEQKSTNAFGRKASKAFAPAQPEHGSCRAFHHNQPLHRAGSPVAAGRELAQLSTR